MMPKKHFFGLDIGQTTPQVVNFQQKEWTNKFKKKKKKKFKSYNLQDNWQYKFSKIY